MTDKKFANGLIAKRNDRAPDFVLCNLSVKVDEFIHFLNENDNKGWVNIDVKRSKSGKIYAELNEWKPDNKPQMSEQERSIREAFGGPNGGDFDDDIPFAPMLSE